MEVLDTKPKLIKPRGTRAQNNTTNNVTWSDSNFTWADAGADWGLADAVSGEFPLLLRLEDRTPTLVRVGDVKP